ncbi:unnamed protein product [Lupinus luteus]|uniref:Reverse transcriptase zinc-binding domain-containing protein n=1 Tax=Lupinus luteus TaxID=3873 RepID=A0AAV1XHS9_LUPLU
MSKEECKAALAKHASINPAITSTEVGLCDGLSGGQWCKWGSAWWRELGSLSSREFEAKEEWFSEGVQRRVGSGESVSFWRDSWVGEVCLMSRFSILFQAALDKDASISSSGRWRNGAWKWNVQWRKLLFSWEQEEAYALMAAIETTGYDPDKRDKWIWIHDKSGVYSVKNVPSKLRCFVWRMALQRILALSNLSKRVIARTDTSSGCPFCGSAEETVDHIFLSYPVTYGVWQSSYSWFGLTSVMHSGVIGNFFGH